jgi:hypothetical protein
MAYKNARLQATDGFVRIQTLPSHFSQDGYPVRIHQERPITPASSGPFDWEKEKVNTLTFSAHIRSRSKHFQTSSSQQRLPQMATRKARQRTQWRKFLQDPCLDEIESSVVAIEVKARAGIVMVTVIVTVMVVAQALAAISTGLIPSGTIDSFAVVMMLLVMTMLGVVVMAMLLLLLMLLMMIMMMMVIIMLLMMVIMMMMVMVITARGLARIPDPK